MNEFTVLLITDGALDLKKHGKASVQQVFTKDLLHSRQGAGNTAMGRNLSSLCSCSLHSLEDCQSSLLSNHTWPQDISHWLRTVWTLLQLKIWEANDSQKPKHQSKRLGDLWQGNGGVPSHS